MNYSTFSSVMFGVISLLFKILLIIFRVGAAKCALNKRERHAVGRFELLVFATRISVVSLNRIMENLYNLSANPGFVNVRAETVQFAMCIIMLFRFFCLEKSQTL